MEHTPNVLTRDTPPSSVTMIEFRAPLALKGFTFIGSGILLFCWVALVLIGKDNLDFYLALATLSVLLVVVQLQQRGYRIYWDDDAIYMREWGLPGFLGQPSSFKSMRWVDVREIVSAIPDPIERDGDFITDEKIELLSKIRNQPKILVCPAYMEQYDFEWLWQFMVGLDIPRIR